MSFPNSGARRQIFWLVLAQALLYVNSVTLIAVNGLAGLALAPRPLYATLPITTYIIGSAITTLPASLLMGRFGRRAGFMLGTALGGLGAALATLAMLSGSFALLCLGTLVSGVYNAFMQYLRFAAADVADAYAPELKTRAISWVLAGGIAGGIVGPNLSKLTRDLLAVPLAGAYLALCAVALIAFLATSRLRIPLNTRSSGGPARPLAQIARDRTFILAVTIGALSYAVMNLLMTATPLAMSVCGFGYPATADVITWHVIAMFTPGFFTGALLQRFGAGRIISIGCALMFGAIVAAHGGIAFWNFWLALAMLGAGWNLMFTGATTLLTTTYSASEKSKVQGINDLVVFLTMITSSAASGALVSTAGWLNLNLFALPAVVLALIAVIVWVWLARGDRGSGNAASGSGEPTASIVEAADVR